MTENRIKLLGALIGAVLMLGFGFGMYGLVSSCSPDGVPRDDVLEYYNDDTVYFTVIGQITEYEEYKGHHTIKITTGDVQYICEVPPKSIDILRINEFDFSVGGVYKFTIGNCYDFDDGMIVSNPIVAVKSVMNSLEYLSYDVGKANMVDYLKQNLE